MKTIKVYFYKHGFETDGVSLWVVQEGNKKHYTKKVTIERTVETRFQNRNPHAYLTPTSKHTRLAFQGWQCGDDVCFYNNVILY